MNLSSSPNLHPKYAIVLSLDGDDFCHLRSILFFNMLPVIKYSDDNSKLTP